MARRIYITDKELAAVLEVSMKTLYRMAHGFYRKTKVAGGRTVDVRTMLPDRVAGVRRWRISRVAEVLGVAEDEIMDRIS